MFSSFSVASANLLRDTRSADAKKKGKHRNAAKKKKGRKAKKSKGRNAKKSKERKSKKGKGRKAKKGKGRKVKKGKGQKAKKGKGRKAKKEQGRKAKAARQTTVSGNCVKVRLLTFISFYITNMFINDIALSLLITNLL